MQKHMTHIATKGKSLGLKSKLVLSYLLVILGTVIVLSFAVSLALQNYFHNLQVEGIQSNANALAEQFAAYYRYNGSWNNIASAFSVAAAGPDMLEVTDNQGNQLLCKTPRDISDNNCQNSTVTQSIQYALKTQNSSSGDITLQTIADQHTISSVYVSVPIVADTQTVGSVFVTQPLFTPEQTIFNQINQYIILAGLIVAVIAALCSYLFASGFVRPLKSLTVAAEQMKQHDYTERVPLPATQDEVGRLAQTFNEMADTIEEDVNELKHQDQMRRELIANIAHDLATPLTAIQGLSEALADDVISEPEARQETAQRIGREVQRLRRLVADVRQMTLIEARQIPLDLAPLDLHSLADETLIVIRPECEQTGISLKNEIPVHTPQVQADSDRITQVLLNLLDNARRHTTAGGSIRIVAQPQNNVVQIAITDTGMGITPKDLPHIFERFYRADRSRASITGGSGLGLSIVKAIITAHHGNIWAESKLGVGTSIIFTLPIIQDTRPPSQTHPTTSQLQTPTNKAVAS
jgi:signal transduction histidine kinase